jgi:hypothetical protein
MNTKSTPRLDLMPSAADRWTTCLASPRFCLENADLIPADLSSKFSQEGTTAHEIAAAYLQDREPNLTGLLHPVTGEMRMHGWDYAEYVQWLRNPDPGMSKLIVEQKQPLWYYPGRNAVVDAAVINPDSLHIIDYKYGAGVVVSPVENLQATIYAYQIAVSELPLDTPVDFPVVVHIYQPRGRENGDQPAHIWETTVGEIAARAGMIAGKADIIRLNNETKGNPLAFAPSEKACRWCPAKAFCPARQNDMLDGIEALAVIEETPPALPLPSALPIEQLAAVIKHRKKIAKWLDDAEEYATNRLREGHEVPGFKLVMSRGGNRYWADPKKAAELLVKTTVLKRDEVVEENTISPAAAEKLVGKKKFSAELEGLITRAPGGPEIAPEDDKRESCVVSGESEFAVLTDESLDRLDDY